MFKEDVSDLWLKRPGERGSAIVMVLLLALLMLIASAGVLLEASLNTANVTDSTAEQQAYNAAESGIQSAINVLRGNVAPNPLIDASQVSTAAVNQISFYKAADRSASNYTNDPSGYSRLSRWVGYNYTPPDATAPDRVAIGGGTYSPATGAAYSLEVRDPDNTGTQVTYGTSSCDIDGGGNLWSNGAGDRLTITCGGIAQTTYNVATGLANATLGSWTFDVLGKGAAVPKNLRFTMTINMTYPYTATKILGGYIEAGTVNKSSVGSVRIRYDTEVIVIMGSSMALKGGNFISDFTVKPIRIGYVVQPNAPNTNGGVTQISASVTPAEPVRLFVRSTGYGPRGAKKILETVIQKNYFNNGPIPATLLMIGGTTGFSFVPGTASGMQYSGDDMSSNFLIPPIGVTNDTNLATVNTVLTTFNGDVVGTPSNVTAELPTWLSSATNLYYTMQALKTVAKASGGYYVQGQVPRKFGDLATSKGITYLEGNGELSGSGGGILVCTGTLTLKGPVSFNGIIIVTGPGGLIRSGTGNSLVQGNFIVAPFNQTNPAAGWLGPKYDLSGGGASSAVYNSSNMYLGMTAVSNFTLGVAEE